MFDQNTSRIQSNNKRLFCTPGMVGKEIKTENVAIHKNININTHLRQII